MIDINEPLTGNLVGFTARGKDYWSELIEVGLEPKKEEEKKGKSFAYQNSTAIANAKKTGEIKLQAQTSTATQALWRFLWEHVDEEIEYIFAPHGNKTATLEHPHIKGVFTIDVQPPISVKAAKDEHMDFSVTYKTKYEKDLLIENSTLGTGSAEEIE